MTEGSQFARGLRFAAFELDLASGELRKQGAKIKLQEQPFQVLALLVQHAGEVVTREELRQTLWPEDTFVDFEHSLATAINKAREALGDMAQNPRFIETLPKRGYRFISPVESLPPGPSGFERGHSGGRACAASSAPVSRGSEPIPAPGHFPLGNWLIGAAIALALAAGTYFAFRFLRARQQPSALASPRNNVPLSKIRSIAVLPLENLSRHPDQDYFADGMTDELINTLAKILSLRVISRASIRQFKSTTKSTPEIARELGVDALLEGSVFHSGGRVRISVELVDSTDHHLWANDFQSSERDVLILQDQLARDIAEQIELKLQPAEEARLTESGPINAEAHDAYLKALFFYYRETVNSGPQAFNYLHRAIRLDPGYAEAYALLAACHYDSSESRGGKVPNSVAAERAKSTALKALQLDSSLAEPHVVLGAVAEGYDWNWPVAQSEFERAIQLDPNLLSAHVGLAWHWTFMGNHEAAIREINRAVELDPVSLYTLTHQVLVLFYNRKYDEARQQAIRALDLFPDSSTLYALLARSYEMEGMYAQAVQSWQQQLRKEGKVPSAVAALGDAFNAGGIRGAWQWQLDRLLRLQAANQADPYQIAEYSNLLGQKDEAIRWIEKEYPRRGQGMLFVEIDPRFDSLRSDPRFQSLMARMRFPR